MSDDAPDRPEDRGDAEFGPSGYLPERAAHRARKIVLRAPLGLQWVLGAVAAGVVILVVAVVFFATRGSTAPGAPYVEVGPVAAVEPARYDGAQGVLFVAASGRVRTFAVEDRPAPVWCEESGHVEGPDGRVWSPTGRALDGAESLSEHPTVVVDGVVYVDFTRTVPGPPAREVDAEPACF